MEESRMENALNNAKTGLIVQVIKKIVGFIVRTIFIKVLNSEYLGINSLFTNVLMILSFAELGIGTAIIFNMYKPIAEENQEKIKSLMKLYEKSYNIIGITIFILGLAVIPFMNYIAKDVQEVHENIVLIYILFLINTSLSYFFIYKKSVITAYQQESVVNKINSYIYILKSILEIIFLITTKNYIIYLVIQIVITIFTNITISRKAEKIFPYLKEKKYEPISHEEKKNIFLEVKSLVVYKIGVAISDGIDNILISILLNVNLVGLCSNYILVITSVKELLLKILNDGLMASIGNLKYTGTKKQKKDVLYQLTFISFWIYDICAIAFILLLNPFIEIWLGHEYVLERGISIALAVNFFICGIRTPCYTYRMASGLFKKGTCSPYIESIVNIVLSIILCKKTELIGIFIASSIAQLLSYSWIDPYLIHKYELKHSLKEYVKKCSGYVLSFIFALTSCLLVSKFLKTTIILEFIIKILIVIIIPSLINIIMFYKQEEYKKVKEKFVIPTLKRMSAKF